MKCKISGPTLLRNLTVAIILTTVLALVFFAGWWASNATFGNRVAKSTASTSLISTALASEGSVGRAYNFSVSYQVPTAPLATNFLTGVITQVGTTEPSQGDVLYKVGDTPVIAIAHEIPFYRALEPGAKGDDVRALQQMLKDRGFFSSEPDSEFGAETTSALKAFQKSIGAAETGIISIGGAVAISQLPSVVEFSKELRLGKNLNGGEELISGPVGERQFFISLSPSQREFVPIGASVEFNSEGNTYYAVVSSLSETEVDQFTGGNQLIAFLSAPNGSPVCEGNCPGIPNAVTATFLGQLRPEPAVSGITVPAAAVQTSSAGNAFVQLTDGSQKEVEILGSGQGLVVVKGIEEGTEVLLNAQAAINDDKETEGE